MLWKCHKLPYLATILLPLSGCAAVPTEAGFPDVERAVAERTGLRVIWNRGTESDKAVEARVHAMLAKELTADEAVQVALLNNQSLQATYEDLMVAQADLVAAGLLRNPIFDAEIRFPEGGGGTGLELAVVQDFIDIFFIPLRRRVAGASFDAAKARVAGEVLGVAGEVRAAFYTHQAAEQTLEMRRQVVAATEASYDIARRLRAAGNIRELDAATERTLYEQARLDLRAAEAQVVQTRERLNRLMGLWGPQTTWTAAARLPELPSEDPAAPEAIERQAVARSLDLESARRQIEAASAALGLAAPFGLIPEAEAGVSAEREPDGAWAVGPAFSLPIPLFNQGQPGVASAQAELRRSRQLFYAAAVNVRSRVRASYDATRAARELADHYRKVILPLRQQIVDETQLQYNAMQISPLQLLLAKQQQIDAGAAYIGALRRYWVARTELELILNGKMGGFGGSAVDFEEPTAPAAVGRGGH